MSAPLPEPSADSAYTDIATAATYFDVSRWTIGRWIERGHLPATRLPGGIIRIPVAALSTIGEAVR